MSVYSTSGFDFRKDKESGDFLINPHEGNIKNLLSSGLKFKNIEINSAMGLIAQNLDFLALIDFIEGISIVGSKEYDLSSLARLKNLKYLRVTTGISQSTDFSRFENLEYLCIDHNRYVKNVAKLPGLRTLIIHAYKNSDLTEFEFCNNLKSLSLIISSISSLVGIQNLKRMECLNLFKCKALLSLDNIENLEKLETLDLEGCPNFKDLAPLKNLELLSKLYIHDCKDIKSIKPIKDLHNLQVISLTGSTNIIDGDMTPLLGRKHTTITPRSHYVPPAGDIEKVNGIVYPKQSWDY
jgi:hypothetical protein